MAKIQIGWLNLMEDKVFTDRGYECAAWWQDIAVKAGKYPMFIDGKAVWDNGRVDGTARVTAELPGIVTSAYAFSFAEWVSTEKVSDGISLEILDGFKVNVGTRYSTVYEKEVPDYDIFKEV